MEILLLGALMVGLPVIIIGCVAAWRERKYNEQPEQKTSYINNPLPPHRE